MPSKKIRIKLYADECFPIPSVTHLRSKGVSIIHAYDLNLINQPDKVHLKESKKMERVLITLDRDFLYYKGRSTKNHHGIIIISVGAATPKHVNLVLDKTLKILSPNYVRNALIKITTDKIIKEKSGKRYEKSF